MLGTTRRFLATIRDGRRGWGCIAALGFALGVSFVHAGESVTHPTSCLDRTLGDPSWKDSVEACKKTPEADTCSNCVPESGCAPYCMEDIIKLLEGVDLGNCPAVLPAPGKPMALAMVSGRIEAHAGWEVDVGFGPGRPLNYLSRLYVAPDGKSAKAFMPAAQRSAPFTAIGDNLFELSDGGMSLPGGTRIAVTAEDVQLRFSDGRLWRYEATDAHKDGGRVFRIVEMRDRKGRSGSVRNSSHFRIGVV